MKGLYTITEILLIAGLIYFGEVIGTGNMWYVVAAIISAHIIMDFMYKLRRFNERKRRRNNTSQIPMYEENAVRAEENANIKVRHFYNDVGSN